MKSNFQREGAGGTPTNRSLIDPEAYDASEQQFAASLEEHIPRNVAEEETFVKKEIAPFSTDFLQSATPADAVPETIANSAPQFEADQPRSSDPDAWRQEVSARLDSYRARRRPRAPRYPSLQLKFEPAELAWASSIPAKNTPPFITERPHAGAEKRSETRPGNTELSSHPAPAMPSGLASPEPTARVLPFRRVSPAPPKPLEELAEPMQLFPRILEVPEVAPPPPALGGILIEPEVEESSPKRPGIEIPLQTAGISRRILAALCDGGVVFAAFSLFAYIFFEIAGVIPPWKESAEMAAVILGIIWAGYQFLLLTYAANTPGLWLASLRLSQFDGALVSRPSRRWRACASILSAVSLGLGYAWCMLDEDQLCWHDRITRTHLAPR